MICSFIARKIVSNLSYNHFHHILLFNGHIWLWLLRTLFPFKCWQKTITFFGGRNIEILTWMRTIWGISKQQSSCPTNKWQKSITNLHLYKASGLQSTNLFALKNDHNLQVFTPFHLQSTAKFWPKSTIYI